MTRQIADTLSNNGHDYDIIEVEGGELYRPLDSWNVCPMSTACARGFYGQYHVSAESYALTLTKLTVRTTDNVYPPLDGVHAVAQGLSLTTGEAATMEEENVGVLFATYVGLQIPMSHFTGRMLVGCKFLPQIDTFDATSYEHVMELHVIQGRMTNAINVSQDVATRRLHNQTGSHSYRPYSWTYDRYLQEKEAGDISENDDDL